MADIEAPPPSELETPAATPAAAPATEKPAESSAAGSPPKHAEKPAETAPEAAARKILVAARRAEAAATRKLTEAKTLAEQSIARAELKKLVEASPAKFLAENAGLTVEEFLAAYQKERTGEAPKPTAEEEIAALKKERADERRAIEEQAEAEAIVEIKAGIRELLSSPEHLEAFDLINTRSAHDRVADEALDYAKKYPDMTADQGRKAVLYFARKIEAELDSDVVAISKSKKFQQRFAPRVPAAVPAPGAQPADATTLVNSVTRAAPPPADGLPTGNPDARWAAIKARAGLPK